MQHSIIQCVIVSQTHNNAHSTVCSSQSDAQQCPLNTVQCVIVSQSVRRTTVPTVQCVVVSQTHNSAHSTVCNSQSDTQQCPLNKIHSSIISATPNRHNRQYTITLTNTILITLPFRSHMS